MVWATYSLSKYLDPLGLASFPGIQAEYCGSDVRKSGVLAMMAVRLVLKVDPGRDPDPGRIQKVDPEILDFYSTLWGRFQNPKLYLLLDPGRDIAIRRARNFLQVPFRTPGMCDSYFGAQRRLHTFAWNLRGWVGKSSRVSMANQIRRVQLQCHHGRRAQQPPMVWQWLLRLTSILALELDPLGNRI